MYAVIEGELHGPVRWRYTGEDEQSVEGDALVEASRAAGGLAVGDAGELLSGIAFNAARSFLAAIRDGTKAEPDFHEALLAHRLVDAIYASADQGGVPISYPER
jgi:predicted dehydrogenase